MRKNQTGHLVKTNPNKANFDFTAENAEVAEKFSDRIYRIKKGLKKTKNILFILSKKGI